MATPPFDKKSDDIDNKLPDKNIKIKPNNTVKKKVFLPFSFSIGGKKKTRKHKRKRATRRRARR